MQQKEVIIISGVIIIGLMIFLGAQQQRTTITGAHSNGYCQCPYNTGDGFIDSDFQLKDGTWLWNFLGILWSDSSPRYVAHATGCLSRGPDECWTQTCLVILGDTFGNNEVREYRCGWPPPPDF